MNRISQTLGNVIYAQNADWTKHPVVKNSPLVKFVIEHPDEVIVSYRISNEFITDPDILEIHVDMTDNTLMKFRLMSEHECKNIGMTVENNTVVRWYTL